MTKLIKEKELSPDIKLPVFETLTAGIPLAIVGGFIDIYSYLFLGHVFASMQSGNVLLMGMNLAQGKLYDAGRYAIPIICFTLGIGLSSIVESIGYKFKGICWQNISLLIEAFGIVLLVAISQFIDNETIVSLLSILSAFQYHTFRTINGHGTSTTVITGNIRSASMAIVDLLSIKRMRLNRVLLIDSLAIIVSFCFGSFIGTISSQWLHERSLLIITAILISLYLFELFQSKTYQKSTKHG